MNQAVSATIHLPTLGEHLTLRSDCQSRPVDLRWIVAGLQPAEQILAEVAGRPLPATADAAGTAALVWDGRDAAGAPLESAVASLTASTGSHRMRLGRLDARRFGLGGFLLAGYDRLDVVGRRMRTGWGRLIGGVAFTRAGDGYRAARGDGRAYSHFDADGFLTEIADASGAIVGRFTRDVHGLTGQHSHRGNLTVRRDGHAIVLERHGHHAILDCGEDGRVRALRDGAGNTLRVEWDDRGMLTGLTEPTGFAHRYEYDDDGRLVAVHRPGCGPTRLQRASIEHGHRITVLTAELRETSYSFEKLPDGTRVRTRRCCGLAPEITRINGPRVEVERGDGVRIASDRTAGERRVTLPSGLTNSRIERAGEIVINGRIWRRTATAQENVTVTPEGRVTRATFRDGGIDITDAAGASSLEFDAATGAVTRRSAAGAVTLHSNELGLLSRVTYDDGREVLLDYDGTGWLREQRSPDGRSLRLERGPDGTVRSVTPPGKGATAFAFDAPARVSGVRFPAVGDGIDFEYDGDGMLVAHRSGTGERIETRRDSDGLVYEVVTGGDETLLRAEHRHGRPTRVETGDGSQVTQFTWDGPLLTATTGAGVAPGSVTRSYDTDFLLTGLRCGTLTAPVIRDRDGLITGLGPAVLTRDENGDVTAITAGQVVQRWERDAQRRVTAMELVIADRPVWQVRYWYERAEGRNRIAAVTDSQLPMPQEVPLRYDAAGRLASAGGPWPLRLEWDENGNPSAVTRVGRAANGSGEDAGDSVAGDDVAPGTADRVSDGSAGDDAAADILREVTYSAIYDDADRPTALDGQPVEHDAAGRLVYRISPVTGAGERFEHDAIDHLTRITRTGPDGGQAAATTVRLRRDGLSNLVAIEVDGEVRHRFVPGPNGYPDAEVDADGRPTALYAGYDSALPPVLKIELARVVFLATDHLGSPRFAVDVETGEILQQRAYDHGGMLRLREGDASVPFGWGGGLTDGVSDLTHFPARSYDPHLLRFLTRDPLLFRTGATNLYSFAGGDPVNRRDPTGLQQVELCRQATGVGAGFVDGAEHWWIKQGGVETGMAAGSGGNVLQRTIGKIPAFQETSAQDHTGRSQEDGVTCDPVENVDEECVAHAIDTGPGGGAGYTGNYSPLGNTCQNWVDDVLSKCSGGDYTIHTNDPDAYNHWYNPTGHFVGDSSKTQPGVPPLTTPPPSDTSGSGGEGGEGGEGGDTGSDDGDGGDWDPYGANAIGPDGPLWGG